MASVGPSFGDIVSAITILADVVRAFDNARGAPKKYNDSVLVLSGLKLVKERLQVHGPSDKKPRVESHSLQWRHRYKDEVIVILDAMQEMEAQLNKRCALGETKFSLRKMKQTVKSVCSDLGLAPDHIQELKTKISDHVSILQMLITIETSQNVQAIRDALEGSKHASPMTTASAADAGALAGASATSPEQATSVADIASNNIDSHDTVPSEANEHIEGTEPCNQALSETIQELRTDIETLASGNSLISSQRERCDGLLQELAEVEAAFDTINSLFDLLLQIMQRSIKVTTSKGEDTLVSQSRWTYESLSIMLRSIESYLHSISGLWSIFLKRTAFTKKVSGLLKISSFRSKPSRVISAPAYSITCNNGFGSAIICHS